MKENEIWKPIIGYPNYEVSNLGRVKRLPYEHRKNEHISFGFRKTDGYRGIVLCKDGTFTHFFVHRLVAAAFIPNPLALPFVNHKNENKEDNRAENLEWCDGSYNMKYGTNRERAQQTHEKNNSKRARKKIAQYTKDGKFIAEYKSIREANRALGKSEKSTSIFQSLVHRNNQYFAYGYLWKLV